MQYIQVIAVHQNGQAGIYRCLDSAKECIGYAVGIDHLLIVTQSMRGNSLDGKRSLELKDLR